LSTSTGPYIEFSCLNDCRETGCPGHKLRAIFSRTSDVLSFEMDGTTEWWFDEHLFAAMVKADAALTEQEKRR
jgi:hypothetical protein